MFVSEDRGLPVSFAVASSRLEELARGRLLNGPFERVYHGGVEHLLRVGPAGAVPGASRLVRVRFTSPVHRDGEMTVALRWEATGPGGGLFPALDADIQLTDDGGDRSVVTLTGSYRPPLGALGDKLDRMLLHAVALATIRALLTQIAATLEGAPAEASDPVPGCVLGDCGASRVDEVVQVGGRVAEVPAPVVHDGEVGPGHAAVAEGADLDDVRSRGRSQDGGVSGADDLGAALA